MSTSRAEPELFYFYEIFIVWVGSNSLAIWRPAFLRLSFVGHHKLHTACCKFDITDTVFCSVCFFFEHTGCESDNDSREVVQSCTSQSWGFTCVCMCVCVCVSVVCQKPEHRVGHGCCMCHLLLLFHSFPLVHSCAQKFVSLLIPNAHETLICFLHWSNLNLSRLFYWICVTWVLVSLHYINFLCCLVGPVSLERKRDFNLSKILTWLTIGKWKLDEVRRISSHLSNCS